MRLTIFVVLVCMPMFGHAWSGTGHRIICEIAYQEITSNARKEVDRLIAQDTQYSTFADACNFPDEPRQRSIEHYINFPRNTSKVVDDECLLAEECLFTAIKADVRVLELSSSTDLEKLTAIKFLGHWVGDLHQPMHISFADDRGGNKVAVEGRCQGSMHSIWDACMIIRRILEEPHAGEQAVKLAERWRSRITNVEREQWQRGSLGQWADETFQITKAASTRYCDQIGDKCIYDAASGRQTYTGGTMKLVTANKAYINTQAPIIKDRLMKAGVRLAYVLNNSL